MTSLRIETLYLPAAELGPENPLPVLAAPRSAPAAVPVDPSVPDWARVYLGYGCGPDILPYRLQDGYTQARQPRPFKTAVLENDESADPPVRHLLNRRINGRFRSDRKDPAAFPVEQRSNGNR